MIAEDTAQDLTTVNVAMQKQQMIESEMVKRAAQMESLQVGGFLLAGHDFQMFRTLAYKKILENGTAVGRNAS